MIRIFKETSFNEEQIKVGDKIICTPFKYDDIAKVTQVNEHYIVVRYRGYGEQIISKEELREM